MVSPYGSVLVVDDLRMNRLVLSRMVKKLGFDVLEAEDGRQAVDVFLRERDRCAFIFLDLVMPIKDGYDTAREVRGLEQQLQTETRTPIVAYTAERHDHVVNGQTVYAACKSCGMDDFLCKPVSMDAVQQVFCTYVPSFRSTSPCCGTSPMSAAAVAAAAGKACNAISRAQELERNNAKSLRPTAAGCQLMNERTRELLSRASADHVSAHDARMAATAAAELPPSPSSPLSPPPQQQQQQAAPPELGAAAAPSPSPPAAVPLEQQRRRQELVLEAHLVALLGVGSAAAAAAALRGSAAATSRKRRSGDCPDLSPSGKTRRETYEQQQQQQ